MRQTRRFGKISAKLALLATAMVVGTGATIPLVISPGSEGQNRLNSQVASNEAPFGLSEQDFASPTFSVEASNEIETSDSLGPPIEFHTEPPQPTTSPAQPVTPQPQLAAPSPQPFEPPSPAMASTIASPARASESAADPILALEPSLPSSSATVFEMAKGSNKTSNTEDSDADSPFVDIQVFFATNRSIVDPHNSVIWLKVLLPGILALSAFLVMMVAVFRSRVPWIWGSGAAICCLLGIWFTHGAIINVQRLNRIAATDSVTFANGRNSSPTPLTLGYASVTVPKNKTAGHIPTPSLLTLEFSEDESRHVVIQSVQSCGQDEFMRTASDCMNKCSNEALIFVHGYNVTFDAALRRTAQLYEDLDFDGVPFLFSWPSHGSLLRYSQDEGNASWSIVHLERFLTDLRRVTGVERVHIIAHSMGNRVLLGAVERMQLQHEFDDNPLGQVVLAAPDVDVDEFRNRYADSVADSADQVTLYISGADRALVASRHLHGYDRLGLSTLPEVNYFAGVQVIDVSEIDTSVLGHSYYGSNALLLKDLRAIVELGSSPSQRQWLTELSRQDDTRVAYQFDPARIEQIRGSSPVIR